MPTEKADGQTDGRAVGSGGWVWGRGWLLTLPGCAEGEGTGEDWGTPSSRVSDPNPLREGVWRAGSSPGPQASRPLPLLLLLPAMCSVWHARQEAQSC